MRQYYVGRSQPNGDREVHHEDCEDLPQMQNRTYLGTFADREDAIKAAKRYYGQVSECRTCFIECHTPMK